MAALRYRKLKQGSLQKQVKKPKRVVHGVKKPQATGSLKAGPAPAAPSAPAAPTAATPAPATPAPAPAAQTPNAPTPDASGDMSSFLNVSSFNPATGQPDPRDSSYWADLAALQASAQQEYAGVNLEQSYADTDYTRRLGVEAEDNRRDVRDTAEGMIGTGLLRSGRHNRVQTEKSIDYGNLMTGLASDKSRGDAQRKAQMAAIISNLNVGEMGLYAEAGGRYSDAQSEQAAQAQALADLSGAPVDNSLYGLGSKRKKRRRKK